jgi:hypothetical protein
MPEIFGGYLSGIAEGEQFTLALRDGRVYQVEVERITGGWPIVF